MWSAGRSTIGATSLLVLIVACTSPTERRGPTTSTVVSAEDAPRSTDDGVTPAGDSAATPARWSPLAVALPRLAGGDLPAYPPISRRLGEEGTVVVALDVRQDGEVTAIAVASSSGVQRLDEAVLAAARTWRFLPRTGERGVDRMVHRFVFRLERP